MPTRVPGGRPETGVGPWDKVAKSVPATLEFSGTMGTSRALPCFSCILLYLADSLSDGE